jgi:hypothetical protein
MYIIFLVVILFFIGISPGFSSLVVDKITFTKLKRRDSKAEKKIKLFFFLGISVVILYLCIYIKREK